MPIPKTIAAGLYHALALSTLAAPLAAAPSQSKLPAPAGQTAPVKQPAPVKQTVTVKQSATSIFPVEGTFSTQATEEQFSRTVASGIELTTTMRRGANGPLQLFVTRVNLHPENSDVRWKIGLATADSSVLKATTVTAMSKKERAVVAINGGYFAFGGAALGAVKINNEWIRLPLKNRTAMAFDEKNGLYIGNLQAGAEVKFGRSTSVNEKYYIPITIAIDNLNGYAPENGTSVLTSHFGSSYKLRADEAAIEVEADVASAIQTSGTAVIRPTCWTLIARGTARERLKDFARSPSREAKFHISAPSEWEKYSTILGAGPRLLRKGKIETTEIVEEFRPDVLARGPRSAVGVDAAGQLWFVAADGRDPEYSIGLTIPELAAEMKKLGVMDAICLDGGGSTAMAINSIIVNRPSDGSERRVPNALIVTVVETLEKR